MERKTLTFEGGSIDLHATPPEFPLGARGTRPVVFNLKEYSDAEWFKPMPGILVRGKSVHCTWDAAPIIATHLGCESMLDDALRERLSIPVPMPGKEEYARLGLNKARHDYQAVDTWYLLQRAYALCGEPPRVGKTLISISVSILSGCRKTLVVCPGLSKYSWGEEIAKWAKKSCAILSGRSGDEAFFTCVPCGGRGSSPDGARCPDCKGKGGKTLNVRTLSRGRVSKKNPNPMFRCLRHKEETDDHARECGMCKKELFERLSAETWVVVNYDILAGQHDRADNGAAIVRSDLPGWAPMLGRFTFDAAFCDEAHVVRGFQNKGSKDREAVSRRETLVSICEHIPRVYAITGTPIVGFVRDLWSLLDLTSGGLWS